MVSLLPFLAVLATLVSGRPHHWTPETFPNPRTQPNACGRNVTGWVCDPDKILQFDSANAVDVILSRIAVGGKPFAQAPCGTSGLEGFRIAVALMHRFYESADTSAAAKSFAFALQDAWGVGDPACDNGVVLLLSEFQNEFAVATGSAVDALLPAENLVEMIKDVRVDMAERRYGAALELAATRIGLALAAALQPHDDPHGGGGGGGSGGGGGDGHVSFHWSLLVEEVLLAVGCVSAAVGALYERYRRRRRANRQFEDCRTALEGIRKDHLTDLQLRSGASAAAAVQITTCPLCLSSLNLSDAPIPAAGTQPHAAYVNTDRGNGAKGDSDVDGTDSEGVGGGAATSDGDDVEAVLSLPLISGVTANTSADAGVGGGPWPGVMFPCNHAFCQPCIAVRFDTRLMGCPTCGRPADEGLDAAGEAATDIPAAAAAAGAPAPQSGNSSCSSSNGAQLLARLRELWTTRRRDGTSGGGGGGSAGGDGCYQLGPAGEATQYPVLLFRLHQLQRQYPQYLSAEMTAVWERDLREGRDFDAQQLRNFERRDPAKRRDDLLGSWRILNRSASRLQGLRLWRRRR